jgi:hypothetical protein
VFYNRQPGTGNRQLSCHPEPLSFGLRRIWASRAMQFKSARLASILILLSFHFPPASWDTLSIKISLDIPCRYRAACNSSPLTIPSCAPRPVVMLLSDFACGDGRLAHLFVILSAAKDLCSCLSFRTEREPALGILTLRLCHLELITFETFVRRPVTMPAQ